MIRLVDTGGEMPKRRFLLLPFCSESEWIPSSILIEEFIKNCEGINKDKVWRWINKLERDELVEIQKKGDQLEIKLSVLGYIRKHRGTGSSNPPS